MTTIDRIVAVVPTCRPDSHARFVAEWASLFRKHGVTLVTVWDGDDPRVTAREPGADRDVDVTSWSAVDADRRDLFCRRTDACRNLGFVAAASYLPTHVLTLDDDCYPPTPNADPVQEHLDALASRVPLGWLNAAHAGAPYLRGVPYGVRDEAPVMLSHGVWCGCPDFDGQSQLALEQSGGIPHTLRYYVGQVPRGVLWAMCGMSVMVRREALPHLYYAPMGPDSGVPDLHRFGDIFAGIFLKETFDRLGWAVYSGKSLVLHSRASDARKNFEQEKLGREWLEAFTGLPLDASGLPPTARAYFAAYAGKRARYAELVASALGGVP